MKFGQQDRAEQRKGRKARRRKSGSLAAHRAFAPMLGLWGTMLAGLTIMVLPPPLVEEVLRGIGLTTAGLPVQPIAAGIAAILLGSVLFAIATGLSRRARRSAGMSSLAERTIRSMRPIDPLRDLGSRSLDDPLEAMPFAAPAWRDAEVSEVEPESESSPSTSLDSVPRELDLAAFAEMPGRNAVWVEDVDEPQPAAEPVAEGVAEPFAAEPFTALRKVQPVPEPGTAALARLRAVEPSQLSLVEMVERFAGALHEHRTSPPTRSLTAADLAAREAALAEALKALAALSGESAGDEAREPLRAALAQLQTRRGAA